MVSARAIRAGRANVELGLDKSEFQKQLGTLGRDLQKVGKNLAVGGAALAGLGTAILAPLGKAVKDFAAVGDQLDKMSLRTGVAVEQLSALRFAAEQSGASLESVEKGLKGQARFMVDASRGLATQVDVLKDLNLEYSQLEGLDPAVLFKTLATAIAGVDDETTKAGLALKVFGRAGTELLPLFKQGENGIAALLMEAEKLGIVMSKEDATAAAELTDEMNRLSKTFQQIKLEIGSALAPLLTEFSADRIRPLIKDGVEWAKQNGELVVSLGKVGASAVALGGTLAGLGLALNGIGTSLLFVSRAGKAAGASIVFLTRAMSVETLRAFSLGVARLAANLLLLTGNARAAAAAITLLQTSAGPIGIAMAAIGVAVGAASGAFDPLLEKMREFLNLNAQMPGQMKTGVAGQNPFSNRTASPEERDIGSLPGVSGELTPGFDTEAMREGRRQRREDEIAAARERERQARDGQQQQTAPGMDLQAIGRGFKLEFDIKKSQIGRGLNLGKQWAEEFWDGMEEERRRREGLMADIAMQQDAITNQEQAIATARDNTNIITGSSSAAVAGLGTNSIDQRQLDELEDMKKELIELRKELAGER